MVGEVNKIIYNMLVSGRGVYLPEIGSLYIERQAARKISADKLLSPRNVVTFQSGEQAPSLVQEIVKVAGCGEEQAADIYNRWSAKTREGHNVTISGVGVLNHKSFVMESTFASAINPKGVKTIVIRRRSNKWLYALCAVCVLIALGFCGYMMLGDGAGVGSKPVSQPAQSEAVASAESAAASVVESDSVAQMAENKPTTAVDSTTALTANNATPQTEQPAQSVVANSNYQYYVVMGIFSTEENAQRAVAQSESRIKDLSCKVLPFKDKYMVTLFGSDKIADCNAFANSYRDIYADLWVYQKK